MVDQPISFIERRQKLLEERAKASGNFVPPPSNMPAFKPEDIPDVLPERSEEDLEMDRIIGSIDIITAYRKWCGKSQVKPGNRTEGIKVSCPKPDHPDKDPSAWLNTDKGTWYCGGCEEGGDSHDIAAYHFGYPVPGYKEGQQFHKLREQMAESFGYHIKKVPGGQIIWKEEEQKPDSGEVSESSDSQSDSSGNSGVDTAGTVEVTASPGPSAVPAPESTPSDTPSSSESDKSDTGNVSHMFAEDAGKEELVIYPSIDWRSIVPEETFLYEYMKACTNDDSPEEYHFWHGLLALGHACGRKVTLDDNRPVYGNLLVCLLGGTGTGKSRSLGWLSTVIKAVMPYKETGTETQGVKMVAVPGSGEYLVSAFRYEGRDPANNKVSLGYKSVNGIVDFDEMSALLARANRQGSTLKSTIMGFADTRDLVSIGSLAHGDTIAVEPFCSLTASTQPKAIRTILNRSDTGSGFLNRWVFAGGPAKEREVIGGSHSNTIINLDEAIDQLKKVRAWGGFERSVRLDDEAVQLLTLFYRNKLLRTQGEDDTDLLKRLDLLFKKLLLLFTINQKIEIADGDLVRRVISLFDYVVECYAILNQNIGITQSTEVANTIQTVIQRHVARTGRGASIRDIQRYIHRKNFSNDQVKKAIETMVALDMIEVEKKPTGGHVGRPTVRYVAVSEV